MFRASFLYPGGVVWPRKTSGRTMEKATVPPMKRTGKRYLQPRRSAHYAENLLISKHDIHIRYRLAWIILSPLQKEATPATWTTFSLRIGFAIVKSPISYLRILKKLKQRKKSPTETCLSRSIGHRTGPSKGGPPSQGCQWTTTGGLYKFLAEKRYLGLKGGQIWPN